MNMTWQQIYALATVKSLTINLQYCTVEDNKEMTSDERFKRAQKCLNTASEDHVQAKGISEAHEFNTTQHSCMMTFILQPCILSGIYERISMLWICQKEIAFMCFTSKRQQNLTNIFASISGQKIVHMYFTVRHVLSISLKSVYNSGSRHSNGWTHTISKN